MTLQGVQEMESQEGEIQGVLKLGVWGEGIQGVQKSLRGKTMTKLSELPGLGAGNKINYSNA